VARGKGRGASQNREERSSQAWFISELTPCLHLHHVSSELRVCVVTDREALFRAILANPDDDTLRLIYADALEEANDTQRAAFIRSQVQLARLPEYDPAWIRFKYIDREKLFGDLLDELPALPEGIEWSSDPFRSGLPAAIKARTAESFVRHAEELFAIAPIEDLELTGVGLPEAQGFANCPWLDRLIRLSVPPGLGRYLARILLGSSHYVRLRELHIGAGLSTRGTVSSVLRSGVFKQLTALSYRDDLRNRAGSGYAGDGFVNELIKLSEPPHLQKLDLSENRLTEASLMQLLPAQILHDVEELDLSDNNLGSEGFRVIAAAKLPKLRSLNLSRTRPEVSGVRSLCETGFLSDIRSLNLSTNHLHSSVGEVLAESKAIVNLRVLDLRQNRLGDEGVIALANSPNLRNLAFLDLTENQIGDAGIDALINSPYLAGIVFLLIFGNSVSPENATRLVQRFEGGVISKGMFE